VRSGRAACGIFSILGCTLGFFWGFAEPTSKSGKATSGVKLTLTFDGCVSPSAPARLRFEINPTRSIPHAKVRFIADGDAVFLEGAEQDLGAVEAGTRVPVFVSVQLPKAGRVELRSWIESIDGSGKTLFGQSIALYVIVADGKVFSDNASFTTAELNELLRQKKAGEITEQEYKQKSTALIGRRVPDIPPSDDPGKKQPTIGNREK
jgi:hypothetical protein